MPGAQKPRGGPRTLGPVGSAGFGSPSDGELVRGARTGDAAALGALLGRHRAGMQAVALSVLGNRPDAEDAVQDAWLIAFRRIGDLRDPESAGAWLRMIVRNVCRSRLRSAPPTTPFVDLSLPVTESGPEQVVDRHALRDWIWQAVDQLSPTLRMTVMLRHFSPRSPSYAQMAALCGVPVGTVRSRLSEARRKLVEAMAATADAAHADVLAASRRSAREAVETLAAAEQGRFAELTAERWTPDAAYYVGRQRVGDQDFLIRGMACDLEAGVRQRFVSAVTSRDTTIWEMDLVSPPDAPDHCPPAVAWVMTTKDGRMHHLRLFHASGVRDERTPPQDA
ncbi:RNA polymerase sigma-70 factor, ECF subfamily [Actinacidiphila guanduensis]|uniref:RNA polymerase sigma-70 factor, ECF subfamily n=1 Tax=Actinacidiphila guanduensis TaxID=310781 RepID=A0A1H0FSW9_9ACTN|nr:RNA polymerase sigma-70 factor, ECF subfamily [Actinacidiphila guanduensis]